MKLSRWGRVKIDTLTPGSCIVKIEGCRDRVLPMGSERVVACLAPVDGPDPPMTPEQKADGHALVAFLDDMVLDRQRN